MGENHFVVTIARGFGSGGKEIASRLGKELGIHCYENRILTLAAEYSGLDRSRFVQADEMLNGNKLVNALEKLTKTLSPKPNTNGFVSNKQLFQYQANIINSLADTESCVIVGKCADHVLKGRNHVYSFYIEAPRAYCVKRIMNRMDVSEEEAHQLISKTDKYRADYYEYYSGGNYWTNPVNYDLTLNSEKIGADNCVKVIIDYLRLKGEIE